MAKRRRSGGRSSGAKREGQWGGNQWILTNVPIAGLFFDLAPDLGTVERDRTCVGVRGWIGFSNTGSDAATSSVLCAAKLMDARLDDALAITDDTQGIDASLEDIQIRQLWTYFHHLQVKSANNNVQSVQIEINVKVKIKIPASSKRAFGMFVDASVVNRVQCWGYLRAYYKF